MNNFIGLVCFLLCAHYLTDSSDYIEHCIHYYCIDCAVRLPRSC